MQTRTIERDGRAITGKIIAKDPIMVNGTRDYDLTLEFEDGTVEVVRATATWENGPTTKIRAGDHKVAEPRSLPNHWGW